MVEAGYFVSFFFFQAEDGIRVYKVTGVQTCALLIAAARSAGGFSQKTCLPARAAAMAWARCTECGVARTTACTEASSSASCRTLPEAMSTSRTKRMRSLLPCTDPTSARPQRPRPTMAASITNQGRSALLGLDAGLPDVPRPLRDLALDVRAELIRAQRRRVDAEGGEARLEIRFVHARRDRVVDPADRRARRPRRGDQAVPQHDFVAGDFFADGRDVGRERRALRRGHAQGLQLAALDLREADGKVGEGERDLAAEHVGHRERHAF